MRRLVLPILLIPGLLLACNRAAPPAAMEGPVSKNDSRLSGPYSHQNLTVFLIHGRDRAPGVKYLTLTEAMEQKKIVVHETGDVNELAVESFCDEPIYIQSGEIVKGGKQDRTLGTDLILTRAMGKAPIASFCVEQGRWTRRGSESVGAFSKSDAMVAGRAMKLAANRESGYASQSVVWDSAADSQARLAEMVGEVRGQDSPSSFQLTMESENLNAKLDDYFKALRAAPDGKSDVIGWAYGVNGKISGANVYASHELFMKLWTKLLKSGCVEALGELRQDAPSTQPSALSVGDVDRYLGAAERAGTSSPKHVNDRTRVSTYDTRECVLLETGDASIPVNPEHGGQWLHRSYMTKVEMPARRDSQRRQSERQQSEFPNLPVQQQERQQQQRSGDR
jgi:hypothetical protein